MFSVNFILIKMINFQYFSNSLILLLWRRATFNKKYLLEFIKCKLLLQNVLQNFWISLKHIL